MFQILFSIAIVFWRSKLQAVLFIGFLTIPQFQTKNLKNWQDKHFGVSYH